MLRAGKQANYYVDGESTGLIRGLQFPTGGGLEWDYAVVNFPFSSARIHMPQVPEATPYDLPGSPRRSSLGVVQRRTLDAAGGKLGTWQYRYMLSERAKGQNSTEAPCIAEITKPYPDSSKISKVVGEPKVSTTTVIAPDGTASVAYFSVFTKGPYDCDDADGTPPAQQVNPKKFNEGEYGLPFSRYVDDGSGKFLSTEIIAGGSISSTVRVKVATPPL